MTVNSFSPKPLSSNTDEVVAIPIFVAESNILELIRIIDGSSMDDGIQALNGLVSDDYTDAKDWFSKTLEDSENAGRVIYALYTGDLSKDGGWKPIAITGNGLKSLNNTMLLDYGLHLVRFVVEQYKAYCELLANEGQKDENKE